MWGGAAGAPDGGPGGAGGSGTGSGRTVPVTVTYLEMRSPDQRSPAPGVMEPTAILRAERPTISFYRYLYDTVGADWNWFTRRRLSDEELAAIVHDDRVEVFVLHVRGVPAGYVELDRRVEGEVEIAHFGLIPEYVGRGFGAFLLDWGLGRAWGYRARAASGSTRARTTTRGRSASTSARASRCTSARWSTNRWSTCSSCPRTRPGRPRRVPADEPREPRSEPRSGREEANGRKRLAGSDQPAAAGSGKWAPEGGEEEGA